MMLAMSVAQYSCMQALHEKTPDGLSHLRLQVRPSTRRMGFGCTSLSEVQTRQRSRIPRRRSQLWRDHMLQIPILAVSCNIYAAHDSQRCSAWQWSTAALLLTVLQHMLSHLHRVNNVTNNVSTPSPSSSATGISCRTLTRTMMYMPEPSRA
jgi:hypothetical protein